MVDELTTMTTVLGTSAESLTSLDALDLQTLMAFGMIYEVNDASYWRVVQKAAENYLNKLKDTQIDEIFELITQMKEVGCLSNKALLRFAKLAQNPPSKLESLARII